MSDRNDSFLTWKINNGLFGWDHEYAGLIDMAYEKGVDSGIYELARLQAEIEALLTQVAELEADAKRYRFFRDNQAWRRVAPQLDDPGYDFIGLTFEIHNGFTARVYLDHAIDQRLRQQADEAEKAGGEQ